MHDEPSGNSTPPERIWKIWQSLLLLSPALVMILGVEYYRSRYPGPNSDLAGIFSVMITGPIAGVMCLLITIMFGRISRRGAFGFFFGKIGNSVSFFFGLLALNLAIAFAGCLFVV